MDTDALLSAAQSDSRDPLMHLLGSLAKTEKADDELAALGLELAPLLDKLPDELRHTRVASAASDPDAMRELLAQVRSLLVGRILEEREP